MPVACGYGCKQQLRQLVCQFGTKRAGSVPMSLSLE